MRRELLGALAALLAVALCWPVGPSPRAARLHLEPHAAGPGRARPDDLARRCGPFPCAWRRRLMRPEQAPPLTRPPLLPAGAASLALPGDPLVVGLSLEGRHRAYPMNLLRYHRVVNDRQGRRAIAVLHSPLSGATLCLESSGLGALRHSGEALEGDELVLDGEGSLWSPLLGRRLTDDAAPEPRRLDCAVMRWSAWRRLRPRTELAWPRRPVLGFDYRRDPWAWYRDDRYYLASPVHFLDLRLPHKQEVLGVRVGGETRVFALPERGRQVVSTIVGGVPALVLLDAASSVALAFERRLQGQLLELDAALVERGGTRFNLLGEAVSGPLRGRRLRPLPAVRALFFAWAAHHPSSGLQGSSSSLRIDKRRDEHAR